MFDFKDNLLTRVNKFNVLRELWDKKINYSYNNYVALYAMGEVRLNLLCLLTGHPCIYKRVFF